MAIWKFSTESTALAGSTTRNQSTALTFTVTLSRVIVSCCSTAMVTVRVSIFRCHSMSGMSQ